MKTGWRLVSVFCMSGGHSEKYWIPADVAPALLLDAVPPGWTLVEATCLPAPRGPDDPWEPGIWYACPGSGAKVLCCPEHPVIEP